MELISTYMWLRRSQLNILDLSIFISTMTNLIDDLENEGPLKSNVQMVVVYIILSPNFPFSDIKDNHYKKILGITQAFWASAL